MKAICGLNCSEYGYKECKGCSETDGRPGSVK